MTELTSNTTATAGINPVRMLWQHRHLLMQLWRRDLKARYRGSLLGLLWALLTPLFMLCIYTFVFSVVFQARWGSDAVNANVPFAVLLYSGLIIHQFASEILNRSTTIILNHSNYVKKVVFPLTILPAMVTLSALFMFMIQFALLLLAMMVLGYSIPLSAFAAPLVMLPLILMMLGISWFIASLAVFVRDLEQVMALITTVLLFLSPIFYPVTALPEEYHTLIYLNPLTSIIESMRAVLLFDAAPNLYSLALYGLAGLIVFYFGFWWFQRSRKGFNDIL